MAERMFVKQTLRSFLSHRDAITILKNKSDKILRCRGYHFLVEGDDNRKLRVTVTSYGCVLGQYILEPAEIGLIPSSVAENG